MNWFLFVALGLCLCTPISAAPPEVALPEDSYNSVEGVSPPPPSEEEGLPNTSSELELPVKMSTGFAEEKVTTESHNNENKISGGINVTSHKDFSGGASFQRGDSEETPSARENLNATMEQTAASQTSVQEPSGETPAEQVSVEVAAVQQGTAPQKPTLSEEATTTKIPTTTTTPTTKKPKPTRPKPVRQTTVKPLAEEGPVTSPVAVKPSLAPGKPTKPSTSAQRYPCRCADGTCACCTGIVLENFNVPIRSRACANVTYEPDEFAFDFKLAYNNLVLYNRRMSAKNPRPACIPINRYFGIKMCAKLSNVYMSGRNVHACLDFEGFFDDETAFKYSFNCFRIGSQGVAVVHPEDGGGLPPPPLEEEQTNEDYDDSARGWVGEVETVPN